MKRMNPIKRIRRKVRSRLRRSSSTAASQLFHPSDERIQKHAENLLRELVEIDSLTTDAEGVNRVQNVIARELRSMGFTCSFTPNQTTASGDLLVGTLQGQDQTRFITFVSHADVVMGLDAVGPYRVLPDQLHARGPGVIDNKGGISVAVEGLKKYLEELKINGGESALPKLSLRFVSSANEEAGSPGFQEILARFADDSAIVLGFEPAVDNGSIIESRRGNRWYQIKIKGAEAHAGRCKGEELNAAHEAALKISKLVKLTDIKSGLSVNIGQISGGRGRFNIVCGEIDMKLDTRFSSFESRDKLHRQIESILLTPSVRSPLSGEETQTTYSIADDCPPFAATKASRALLKSYLKTVNELEQRSIVAVRAGGAGDVNYISAENVIVLDGLGAIGGQMHTPEEFIYLPSLSTRAMALVSFLNRIDLSASRLARPLALPLAKGIAKKITNGMAGKVAQRMAKGMARKVVRKMTRKMARKMASRITKPAKSRETSATADSVDI